MSATQMREYGAKVDDKTKSHNVLQNIIVDGEEIPFKYFRVLLHVPLREPTDEDLQK